MKSQENIKDISQLLGSISEHALPAIDPSIPRNDYVPLDLSSNNPDLNLFDTSSSSAWSRYIESYLEKQPARVAYGGYLETRNLYDRSENFNSEDEAERRNIHLGIDLWCNVGTSVHAIFDGVIHSLQDNARSDDYGPTIILQHQFKGLVFHSLYGHLSRESLTSKQAGVKIKQGQSIAALGGSDVNGDYAPHLHFQLILDMQGNSGDYPGACTQTDLSFYQRNCPNPNLLLKL